MILPDHFQHDDGGWLEDVALLDRLVAEKLTEEAEKIAAEGWKWIAAAAGFPYGHAHHLRALDGVPAGLTADEQATLDALNAEYAKLEAEYETAGELPDEVDARVGEIETALAAFEDRPVRYDPAEITRAGGFVKRLPEESMRVYRLQTGASERIIGRLVSPAWVAQAASADGATIDPARRLGGGARRQDGSGAPGGSPASPRQDHG